jgi:LCP family protein required for cell wall assembly
MRVSSIFVMVGVVFGIVFTVIASLGAYRVTRQVVSEAPVPPPPLFSAPTAAPPTLPPTLPPTQPSSPPTAAVAINLTAQPVSPITSTPLPQPVTLIPPTAINTPLTRTTILILGIDQRKGETGNFRTDTMIVLSVDPLRKTGFLLSIPRDIYMQIPATQVKTRINAAYDLGGQIKYPGGAAMLSVRTVQNVIGIKIHHYAVVNFDVFDAAISAVAPVRVCPDSVIHDDRYPDGSYGFMTVHFDPGCQELDATKLLQYARVRHNAGDDFGRSQRQQEVIKSVQGKVLSLGGASTLIFKAGDLWESVKTSIQTDMSFDQLVALGQVGLTIPRENITSAILSDRENFVLPATTPQGEQVFTPNYEKIHALVAKLVDAPPVQK